MVKKSIRLLCGIFIVTILLGTVASATSTNDTIGFETISLSSKDRATLLESINVQLLQDDSQKTSIHSFAVSNEGKIAIGLGAGTNSMVYIYDQSNVFLCGYSFNSIGDYFIAFQGEYLAVYFVRGDNIILLDYAGTCIDVQEVQNPNKTAQHERFEELYYHTTQSHAGNKYELERDIAFGNTYSRLVVTDETGTRSVLYDVTIQHNISVIVKYVLIFCFFVIVVIGSYKKIRFADTQQEQTEE